MVGILLVFDSEKMELVGIFDVVEDDFGGVQFFRMGFPPFRRVFLRQYRCGKAQ
jgi:hypothetical protein